MPTNNQELTERFLKRVNKTDSCWLWQGAMRTKQYGGFWMERTCWYAHRASFHLFKGGLKKAHVVHHRCGNTLCVNPEHLQLATQAENMAEMLGRNSYIATIKELEEEVQSLRKELKERDKV